MAIAFAAYMLASFPSYLTNFVGRERLLFRHLCCPTKNAAAHLCSNPCAVLPKIFRYRKQKGSRQMDKKRELKPYHGLIGLIIAFLILILFSFFGGILGKYLGIWYSVICELLIPATALAIILIVKADVRDSFPFRLPPVKMFFSSVGLYIGTIMLSGAFNMISSRFIPDFSQRGDSINQTVVSMHPVLAVVTIALIPAVCEEIFCRGFLLTSMKSVKNEALIILIAAVSFGLLHMDLYAFIPTALMGGLFAFLTIRTGSLLIPMLLHFFNNAISVISAYTASEAGENAGELLASLSVPQVIGYILFYLGIAAAFLYFSGMWFLGKKPNVKKTVAVIASSAVLTVGGYATIVMTSMDIIAMQNSSFTYDGGLLKRMDLELEEGQYLFSVSATSENDMIITVEKEGETVLISEIGTKPTIISTVWLEEGKYILTLKTVEEKENISGRAEITVSVIRMTHDGK